MQQRHHNLWLAVFGAGAVIAVGSWVFYIEHYRIAFAIGFGLGLGMIVLSLGVLIADEIGSLVRAWRTPAMTAPGEADSLNVTVESWPPALTRDKVDGWVYGLRNVTISNRESAPVSLKIELTLKATHAFVSTEAQQNLNAGAERIIQSYGLNGERIPSPLNLEAKTSSSKGHLAFVVDQCAQVHRGFGR